MQEICQIIEVIFGKKEKSLKLFRPVVRLPGVVHIIINHMYTIIVSNMDKNIPTLLYILYNRNGDRKCFLILL